MGTLSASQPGLHSKTLSHKREKKKGGREGRKRKKERQQTVGQWWLKPLITREAEAGGCQPGLHRFPEQQDNIVRPCL